MKIISFSDTLIDDQYRYLSINPPFSKYTTLYISDILTATISYSNYIYIKESFWGK